MKAIYFIIRWLLVAITLCFGVFVMLIAYAVRSYRIITGHAEGQAALPAVRPALVFDRVRFDTVTRQWTIKETYNHERSNDTPRQLR